MNNNIKWGIVGLGKIARSFAQDLQLSENADITAVASSNEERAIQFANEFNVKTYYSSYEKLFNDSNVDVVYVATIHTSHAELSIMAMNHKKHVLCEKPLALNYIDAKKMINASIENKVFFMEGLWSRFNPSIKKVLELIHAGEIGELCFINADFSFYALDRNVNSRVLNIELGGGSLLDIGIYPIFLAYLLLGKPIGIKASSQFFHNDAEVQTSMIFDYDKAQALLHSSFTHNSIMIAKIEGSLGQIHVGPRWHQAERFTLIKNGKETEFNLPTIGKGFTPEIREVHHCIKNKQLESKLWSHQNSLELIKLIDKVRAIIGVTFPSES